MNNKKTIAIFTIYIFLFFTTRIIFAEEPVKSPASNEKIKSFLPLIYSPGAETVYLNYNTQEITEKSEVKKSKIYFYDKKGGLKRTGNIKDNTVFYDKGFVKKEKISNNKIYQYDKDGNLVGKIWVRPHEIKKVSPEGNVEKLRIKIKKIR